MDMLTRGGLAVEGKKEKSVVRTCLRQKLATRKLVITMNCKKSAEVIVPKEFSGRTEQS